MIFGNAEQNEHFGQIPIGRTKFPESAADCIDSTSRHIDRTKPAMRGKIGRAKLLCPPAGQGLRLITASKKRQLFRVGFADRGKPAGRCCQRLFPANFFKLATATRANTF